MQLQHQNICFKSHFSEPYYLNLGRYDYSGYGQSSGKVSAVGIIYLLWFVLIEGFSEARLYAFLQPSEHNTYADIEAAYKCLEERYGAKQEDIILYGQSVGSGPTVDLAARLPQLRAIVLHSPILSGLRVMYAVKRSYWFDIYKVRFLTWISMMTIIELLYIENVDACVWVGIWFFFICAEHW